MKRIFIIHRWDGTPNSDWYPWLKKELEKKGFQVEVPEMPNTEEPKINSWVEKLKQTAGKIDEQTYFIGHSIGCQAIMRYLETQNENTKIGGAVFIAGWFKLANLESEEVKAIAAPWLNTSINLEKIKKTINKLTVILSSNEPYNYIKENSQIFKDKLNAKIIIEKNKGHFTEDDGIKELPIPLAEFLKIARA